VGVGKVVAGARVPAMGGVREGGRGGKRGIEEEAGKRRERRQSRKRGNEGGKLCSVAFVGPERVWREPVQDPVLDFNGPAFR
jgi:hypothetical protein